MLSSLLAVVSFCFAAIAAANFEGADACAMDVNHDAIKANALLQVQSTKKFNVINSASRSLDPCNDTDPADYVQRSLLQIGRSRSWMGYENQQEVTDGSDILVLVLGYGEPERAPQLISNLNFLVGQAPGVQCIVFVWNSDAPTDGFPSQCRLERTKGVFLTFLQKVPPDALALAQHIFLMADDLELNTDKPVNLLELERLMNSHHLDIASPAMDGPVQYTFMSPTSDRIGRYVDFIEWQAQMVSNQTFNTLLRYIEPQISGCWSYDFFIYSMLLKEQGFARIAILNTMTMVHEHRDGISSPGDDHANVCGRIGPHGEHLAAHDMNEHFRQLGLHSANKTTFGTISEEHPFGIS